MLTLYGDLDSGNVYKVRLLLAQLGLAYRRVDTTQNRGETSSVEFRAINPIGKIPTIVFDDGRMLSESGAILYLLARDTALFPADAWDQANVLHPPAAEQSRLADRIAQNHTRGEHALAVMGAAAGQWRVVSRRALHDRRYSALRLHAHGSRRRL